MAAPSATPSHESPFGAIERLSREVIAALRRLRDPRLPAPRRVFQRVRWEMPVTVHIEDGVGRGATQSHQVRTLDIGPRGFAFAHERHLHRGTLLRVVLPLGDGKHVDGIVRYCKQIGPRQYRVGVRFMRVDNASWGPEAPEFI